GAGYSELRTLQAVGVHELRVVSRDIGRTSLACALPAERHSAGCRIASIERPALNHAERGCRICNCSAVWSDSVLRVRDWNNIGAAGQAHSRHDTDHTIRIRGTHNA